MIQNAFHAIEMIAICVDFCRKNNKKNGKISEVLDCYKTQIYSWAPLNVQWSGYFDAHSHTIL